MRDAARAVPHFLSTFTLFVKSTYDDAQTQTAQQQSQSVSLSKVRRSMYLIAHIPHHASQPVQSLL